MNADQPSQPFVPLLCPQCKTKTTKGLPFCPRCKFDLYHGQLKKSKRGICIYCERYDKLSEEHIYPRWLRNYYPHRFKNRYHYLSRPERYAFQESVPMHREKFLRQGDPYTTTLRNVCEACNNGWMSSLQDQAKSIVKELADGTYPKLEKSDIEMLARWCAMVSINFEHYARTPITNPNQRKLLMSGTMPPGWKISIGILESNQMGGAHFNRTVQLPIGNGESDFIKMQSTYFCIERAVFHTFASHGDIALHLAIHSTRLSEMNNPLQLIWPNISEINPQASINVSHDDLSDIQRHLGPVN